MRHRRGIRMNIYHSSINQWYVDTMIYGQPFVIASNCTSKSDAIKSAKKFQEYVQGKVRYYRNIDHTVRDARGNVIEENCQEEVI